MIVLDELTDKELIDYEYQGAVDEGGTSNLASELSLRLSNHLSKDIDITFNVQNLINKVHKQNKEMGWWNDLYTNESLTNKRGNVPELLLMVHSEITESFEGYRKSLMDNHLPNYDSMTVELADAFLRILDIAGGLDLDFSNAVSDKLKYNLSRTDHKKENRLGINGKKC